MKKNIYLFCPAILFSFSTTLQAQSAPQKVVAATGEFATFSGGSMSWTLGEVMTETYSGSNYHFTQGFNQPDTMYVTIVPNVLAGQILVYPNPLADNLFIDLSKVSGNFVYELFDIQGQLLRKETVAQGTGTINIPFKEFANGIYLLNVLETTGNLRSSYKINKAE